MWFNADQLRIYMMGGGGDGPGNATGGYGGEG